MRSSDGSIIFVNSELRHVGSTLSLSPLTALVITISSFHSCSIPQLKAKFDGINDEKKTPTATYRGRSRSQACDIPVFPL